MPTIRSEDADPSTLGGRLFKLGFKNYAEYLASPHWKDLRSRCMISDRPQKCQCGVKKGLQLHHLTYARLGDENLTDLIFLCSDCHKKVHGIEGERHRRSERKPKTMAKPKQQAQIPRRRKKPKPFVLHKKDKKRLYDEYDRLKAVATPTDVDLNRIASIAKLLEGTTDPRPRGATNYIPPAKPKGKSRKTPKKAAPQPWVPRPSRRSKPT